ncbi:peptidyl-prolyl cis-trans isomerase e [Malassezia pachydermatis]|uniref:Peptidyl-prolyl cis-trans isomerase e n=1 Tax=Malassezia pachydermatis TaxID=77020 RepID=A0A0M8MZ07_9BASI|nr:peptidyl-prolyl cis-trans isomerase e [Malassezia pachydermatis]KOS16570.1 peptidyl-prolyl cis-trans isomerase e [Malassezia pachydermatis]
MSKKTVYIGGLAEQVNEETLLSSFGTFGDISDVQLPKETDQPTKHRGYAFITYNEEEDAEDAIDNMNLNEFHGNVISVNFAKAQKISTNDTRRPIWETDAWLQVHNTAAQPDPQAGEDSL